MGDCTLNLKINNSILFNPTEIKQQRKSFRFFHWNLFNCHYLVLCSPKFSLLLSEHWRPLCLDQHHWTHNNELELFWKILRLCNCLIHDVERKRGPSRLVLWHHSSKKNIFLTMNFVNSKLISRMLVWDFCNKVLTNLWTEELF